MQVKPYKTYVYNTTINPLYDHFIYHACKELDRQKRKTSYDQHQKQAITTDSSTNLVSLTREYHSLKPSNTASCLLDNQQRKTLGLKDIALKEEYRSDRDDIVTEFFIPCLSNCVEYDRCIEYISLKSLTTLALGFDNFAKNKAKLRIVCGHRFNASDLELISKLFTDVGLSKNAGSIRESKINLLQSLAINKQIEIKIAIPNSEEIVGSFSERVGIFTDERGDTVAFTGTSNQTFNTQNRSFESVDVFTSWNDKSRVETKISDFEKLWENKTRYVDIYNFNHAKNNHMLKYSSEWAIET